MLKNYAKNSDGVIYQIEKQGKYVYDDAYLDSYIKLGDANYKMAHLRLGYLIGSLGFAPASVLDVGFGTGEFLDVAKHMIPVCYGNDIFQHSVPTNCTFVEDIFSVTPEVVTFFDAIEHFENPYETMTQLKAEYVVISLPDCHYISDEWFESWRHHKPNEHLWYFNTESLVKFMAVCGYECLNTCNIEDVLRVSPGNYSNILSGVFRRSRG